MAEQQLVSYIKKAREAGQMDNQTKDLLYKNGWTVGEVDDAIMALESPQVQSQPQPRVQPKEQQPVASPEIKIQPQVQQAQPQQSRPEPVNQTQAQSQPQQFVKEPAQPRIQPQDDMPHFRKKHRILKLLIVLIIIFAMGGIGLFVAGQYSLLPWDINQYLNFSWNPFAAPSPETVVSNMLNNMKAVKTYHAVTQVGVSATDKGKISLNADSGVDTTDANNPKMTGSFSGSLTLSGSTSPFFSISTSTVSVDKTLYFKIDNIVIPATYSSGVDVSKINGIWFKVNQDSVKAVSAMQGTQLESADFPQINSLEITQKVQDLLLTPNLFSIDKRLNDEVISGQNAYHYSMKISKDKLKSFIDGLIAAGMSADDPLKATTQTYSAVLADAVGDTNFDIWVGKKDYMLYRYKIDKTIDLNKIVPAINVQLGVKIDVVNSNFNQAIAVQAPESSQKIEDVAGPIIKVQKIREDMIQLEAGARQIFSSNKSYSVLCRNGFVNAPKTASYSQVFIAVVKDIMALGGSNPACFASLQDYCVSTQLSDGSYLCVGKNSAVGKTKCVSYRTVCE